MSIKALLSNGVPAIIIAFVSLGTNAAEFFNDSDLELRVSCEKTVSELRWNYTVWPQRSSKAKPLFSELKRSQAISSKVIDNFQKEKQLQQVLGWYVDDQALTDELERVKANTQDAQKLQQFFKALGDDDELIKECLIRPALVNQLYGFSLSHKKLLQNDWQKPSRENHYKGAALPNAVIPGARGEYTTIWTGNHMIIWGGRKITSGVLGDALNSGYLYDPMLDQWQYSAPAANVEARHQHTAIWTGTEMIVWGGRTPEIHSLLHSGGQFNPNNLTWEALDDQPDLARYSHTAVWTGDEMIIWGGEMHNLTTKGSLYDPMMNMWSNTATQNEPQSRRDHAAVWTGVEMVIWGGTNNDGLTLQGGVYNPINDSWQAMSTVDEPSKRSKTHMVWTGSEVLVWGGRLSASVALDTGGIYSPVNNQWMTTSLNNAPSPRFSAAHTWTGDGMFIWGGFDGTPYALNDGGLYAPNSNDWTSVTDINAPRPGRYPSAVWTGDKVLVWVGELKSGKAYDPILDSWSPIYGDDIFHTHF